MRKTGTKRSEEKWSAYSKRMKEYWRGVKENRKEITVYKMIKEVKMRKGAVSFDKSTSCTQSFENLSSNSWRESCYFIEEKYVSIIIIIKSTLMKPTYRQI